MLCMTNTCPDRQIDRIIAPFFENKVKNEPPVEHMLGGWLFARFCAIKNSNRRKYDEKTMV